jgi:UDP-N-acetylmuramoylalanine--D-glutamate ligase
LKIGRFEFRFKRVTVMGLGLHGGGLASALFFARHGAQVTVTDHRRDPSAFEPFLAELAAHGVRTVLGRHEEGDFLQTDLVVKNPAVPLSSPFLALAREKGVPVETDLSIFLGLCPGPVLAVTGSKGKSTAATALARCLQTRHPGCRLGGNITVSPLDFLEDLQPEDPVVLELSSWQLGDLRGRGLPAPQVALATRILPDHQDKYPDMESYLADKKVLFASQRPGQFAVLNADDPWQRDFPGVTAAQVHWYSRAALEPGRRGAFLEGRVGLRREAGRTETLLPARLAVPGEHSRLNLLAAALGARLFGLEAETIAAALASFPGIEHRLELVAERDGVRIYNDSAATIPEAAAAALSALPAPVFLIAGGTDKNLDFRPLAEAAGRAAGIYLLAGSGSRKIERLFRAEGVPFEGLFAELAQALARAWEAARRAAASGPAGATLLFSPGCASFELFLNEFDRGRKFKELTTALLSGQHRL